MTLRFGRRPKTRVSLLVSHGSRAVALYRVGCAATPCAVAGRSSRQLHDEGTVFVQRANAAGTMVAAVVAACNLAPKNYSGSVRYRIVVRSLFGWLGAPCIAFFTCLHVFIL